MPLRQRRTFPKFWKLSYQPSRLCRCIHLRHDQRLKLSLKRVLLTAILGVRE